MKAVKAISVIVIICLLIDIFGGIKNGTISNGEIVLNAVFYLCERDDSAG